ncbi:uncharacterized protein [Dysidea avara]|uniref:uncharacterized protein n=1 Tax=Dysidea avara TaxID=196820 RepID=UPI00332AAE7C
MRCLKLTIGIVTILSYCSQTYFVDSARVVSLDEELDNLSSHSELLLNNSVLYNVTDFHLIVNLTNVTINGPANITCGYGVGLVFINITGLTLTGITIHECGLTGDNLTIVNDIIHNKVVTSYRFRPGIKVAVFMIGSTDLALHNVTVTKTQGIGMVCVNVLGMVTFSDVMFQSNRPASMDECYKCLFPFIINADRCAFNPSSVSGSLLFLYVNNRDGYPRLDTNVNITRGTFVDNLSCSVSDILNIDAVQFPSLSITDRNATATGGIKLILAQDQGRYYVTTRIVAAVFKNNYAFLGSAISVDIFYDASSSNVSIENSIFLQNGMFYDKVPTYGGSISVVTNIRPFQIAVLELETKHFFNVKGCNFSGNSAMLGGAIAFGDILSSNFYANISQCKFDNNVGLSGSCIGAYGILENSTAITLEDCLFRNNLVNDTSQSYYGTIVFERISTKIRNTTFSDNIGTAVSLSASLLAMDGNIEVQHNMAFIGGALNLRSNSRILVLNNSNILFANNQALYIGGAINVEFVSDLYCPIYFGIYDPYCLLTETCYSQDYNISVSFINNTAVLGSAIFGYILGCPWLHQEGFNITNDDALQFIEANFNDILKFTPNITGNDNVISSYSVMINTSTTNITAIPGQVTTILLSAINYYNKSAISVVSTNAFTQGALASQNYSAELEDPGFQLIRGTTPISIQINGSQNTNVNVTIYSSLSRAQLSIPVHLKSCPPFGFIYIGKSCVCDPALENRGVTCNFTSGRLKRPKNKWMGNVNAKAVVLTCVQNYCSGRRSIDPFDLDDQCVDYRSGVLCGGCREGYSARIDLSGCTNTCSGISNVIIWLTYLVLSALLLLIFVLVLHIYVSDGYLYGVIFYLNVLSTFRNAFFRRSHIFLSVIGANYQDCLYEGVTFLVTGALQFILPAYVFLFMGALTLITKKFNNINRRFSFNFTKAFATFLYVTYNYLLSTSFTILVSRRIKTSSGTVVRWRTDPNVKYFHGWHGLLGAISILMLLVLSLVALVLLFPGVAYRFKVVQKLKPLMDAFQAPFKLRYHFWIGLQLFIRIILNILVIAVPERYQLYCVGLIVSILLYVQTFTLPYKELANSWNLRNYLESLLLLFLLVHIIEVESTDVLVVSAICYSIFVIIYTGIVIYYILHRFPRLKQLVRCSPCKKKEETVDTTYVTNINESVDDIELVFSKSLRTDYPNVSTTDITVTEEGIPEAINYTEFREPLLENDYS